MNTLLPTIDSEIFSSVAEMNGDQKIEVLNYVDQLRLASLSKDRYRREAMKQIREAIANQN